jgi:ParB family chromosome partitioning protein
MVISASSSSLREIPVDSVDRNPENPRLLFRPGELDQLLASIQIYGVQVPISVYKDGQRFVLIDGERRWRCSIKLNKRTIPALIQEKPAPLANLLLMFNIHSLREQWDLLTIALKLPRVIDLLRRENGVAPNERQLSEKTGLKIAVIRRCKLLIDLPQSYKDTILEELRKPKPRQKLTEDFFIEMERALKTVERAMPEVVARKDEARRALIKKYQAGVIQNIVHFRQVAKIARAERVSGNKQQARDALVKLFNDNSYSIDDAFQESVSEAYIERDIRTRVQGLLERLQSISAKDIDDELRAQLRLLIKRCRDLLASG